MGMDPYLKQNAQKIGITLYNHITYYEKNDYTVCRSALIKLKRFHIPTENLITGVDKRGFCP